MNSPLAQNNNKSVKIGDIIYVYESKPTQRLVLKTQVIDRDVTNYDIDDSQYTTESTSFGQKGPWFSLRLVENIDIEINLQDLRDWGLKGNIQSLRQLDDGIVKHIEHICSLDTDLTTIAHLEGNKKVIYTTKYERNPQNRAKALEYQGYTCKACGFNFERTYGDIGKFFIEVHHVTPLFSLDEEMRIDPRKDLVPLCSNCHRMIHRSKTKMMSVSELSRIIDANK
ncbi:HNH endonuclease [Weissella paramesenteroides]|nr:HNH endonuclease [Weissella paramesenteroides]KAA8458473.1 HNH endonuclease [Weissella paramesenteroides]KAA8460380.1 HNH endonuclease [Weissella paramesenteroides]KAA8462775.1 HNH endonuclease [Weissella paramesenteroides]KAA8464086.1 HNH endonuclease [Weissella paramesenteroides]